MDATFPPGVPWKAKETLGSASPRGQAASIKRLYAAANCGLGLKELITNPDRWKARRVMCSTCMSTSPIDSGVCALSCGVSSCCHSAKSVTMRAAPVSLLSCPWLHMHERETVSTHIRAADARRSVHTYAGRRAQDRRSQLTVKRARAGAPPTPQRAIATLAQLRARRPATVADPLAPGVAGASAWAAADCAASAAAPAPPRPAAAPAPRLLMGRRKILFYFF